MMAARGGLGGFQSVVWSQGGRGRMRRKEAFESYLICDEDQFHPYQCCTDKNYFKSSVPYPTSKGALPRIPPKFLPLEVMQVVAAAEGSGKDDCGGL